MMPLDTAGWLRWAEAQIASGSDIAHMQDWVHALVQATERAIGAEMALAEEEEISAEHQAERDAWIRLFNRLEGAVSHWRKGIEDDVILATDERLIAAHDRVLKAACSVSDVLMEQSS